MSTQKLLRPILLGCLIAFGSFAQAEQQTQRQLYLTVKKALDAKNPQPYLDNKHKLQSYTLAPYLELGELSLRLESASSKEVAAMLERHADVPMSRNLRQRWIGLLAKKNPAEFIKYYPQANSTAELDCTYAQQLLQLKRQPEAYAIAAKLWNSGKSQPENCAPVFAAWEKSGKLTQDLRWQRILLAAEAGNYGLGAYLAKSYNNQELSKLLLDTAQNPKLLANKNNYRANQPGISAVVELGLRRLFRQDVDLTLELAEHYAKTISFTPAEKTRLSRQIGVILAKRFDQRAFQVFNYWDPKREDELVAQWDARLLLRLAQWDKASTSIGQLDSELAQSNRWQYWQARSEQIQQQNLDSVPEQYQQLAKQRDFYGFMAAERSQIPFALNHNPIQVSEQALNKVKNTKGILRAYEFLELNNIPAAQLEWYFASNSFNNDELLAQAQLAASLEWHNPAIRHLAQAQAWDDLDIRFPLAYQNQLVEAAQQQGINPNWAYAVTRQESAFMPNIRSHAGAMGLMQVMPATAKETARRYNIPLRSNNQVLNPETNIQLGTAYLNQMMNQFNGNRILATAAYNAGPGRVQKWLENSEYLPYDIWIETIPFDETRQYVQNVLTYSVIYGEKLNMPTRLVEWHEQIFPADKQKPAQ